MAVAAAIVNPAPGVGAAAYARCMSDTHDSEETLGADDSQNPAAKDPSDWVTGDEPMTAPQRSYLDTLACEAG